MKKLIFVGILSLFVLGSCNNSTVTHTHNEHVHAAEGHNHEAEGPDHSHEGECSGEHNHEAADEHNEAAEAHSDEIILPKAKAEAAGVKVSVIEPAPFQQVIKTSGQVLAAQGDESVAVATVAGVVSFRGKVTEGMSVGSGHEARGSGSDECGILHVFSVCVCHQNFLATGCRGSMERTASRTAGRTRPGRNSIMER